MLLTTVARAQLVVKGSSSLLRGRMMNPLRVLYDAKTTSIYEITRTRPLIENSEKDAVDSGEWIDLGDEFLHLLPLPFP